MQEDMACMELKYASMWDKQAEVKKRAVKIEK